MFFFETTKRPLQMRGVGNLSIQQILSNISKQNAFHRWTATANGKASNGCRLVSKIHGIFVGNSCNSIVLFVIVIIIAHQCLKKLVDSKNAALEKCPKCLHLSNRTFFCQTILHGAYAIKQKNPLLFGRHAVRCVSLPNQGIFLLNWCTRRDLNARPRAQEARALSN